MMYLLLTVRRDGCMRGWMHALSKVSHTRFEGKEQSLQSSIETFAAVQGVVGAGNEYKSFSLFFSFSQLRE